MSCSLLRLQASQTRFLQHPHEPLGEVTKYQSTGKRRGPPTRSMLRQSIKCHFFYTPYTYYTSKAGSLHRYYLHICIISPRIDLLDPIVLLWWLSLFPPLVLLLRFISSTDLCPI